VKKRGGRMTQTIRVKRDRPDGTWHAYIPALAEWLPTPFFGPATFEDVAEALRERNPGATVEEAI
jgi:hypothetical protein